MAKTTVVQFSAAWMPGEDEKEDGNCSVSGMIQVIGNVPTAHPAYLSVRDYSDKTPCWWPAVTVPNKKLASYGPEYGDDAEYRTNLHEIKIEPGGVFFLANSKGEKLNYKIVKVDDLAR